MPAPRLEADRVMTSDPDEVVAAGAARIYDLLLQAQAAAAEAIGRFTAEVDQIRREVLDTTGVEILEPSPPKVPEVMDVPMSSLAVMAERCRLLLAAVEVLGEYVDPESGRTVGAVLKTGVDQRRGALVLDYLARSGFYADGQEMRDG